MLSEQRPELTARQDVGFGRQQKTRSSCLRRGGGRQLMTFTFSPYFQTSIGRRYDARCLADGAWAEVQNAGMGHARQG